MNVKPVVGGSPEAVMTLEEVRKEWPVLRTAFLMAEELLHETSPCESADLGHGPTFEELLEITQRYLALKVDTMKISGTSSDPRDIGIYYWRRQALDILETAIRSASDSGVTPIPILGSPTALDSTNLKKFQWSGLIADGKRCHTSKVPCHNDLERRFADFLDKVPDVVRYFKNERFGFSITYYENSRPRQYFPDFIVSARKENGHPITYLAETKGELRPNTAVKREAAQMWCAKMQQAGQGEWRYLFVQQKLLEQALLVAESPQPNITGPKVKERRAKYGAAVMTLAELIQRVDPDP